MRSAFFFAALLMASCIKTLPPPTAPTKEFPKLSGAPPRLNPGDGRVYLDVVEGPASVELLLSNAVGAPTKDMCSTPCFIDLPFGNHSIKMTLKSDLSYSETVVVNVTDETSAERYSLALKPYPKPKQIAIGVTAIITGLIALGGTSNAVKSARTVNDIKSEDPDSIFLEDEIHDRNRSFGFAVGGAITTGVLAVLFKKDPLKKRTGAVTRWSIQETPMLVEYNQRNAENEQAAVVFGEAKARYDIQDYDGALRLFQDAYVLSKEPALLINIAQCYRQMGRKEEAVKSLKAFLRDAPDSELRPEVERLLQDLQS